MLSLVEAVVNHEFLSTGFSEAHALHRTHGERGQLSIAGWLKPIWIQSIGRIQSIVTRAVGGRLHASEASIDVFSQ